MAVYLLPGANQLKASEAIYETMKHAKEIFPPDLDYKIVYDTTPAVEASIESIVHTFFEAVVLVTLVVFVFLQNFRATFIPARDRAGLAARHVHLLPAARLLGEHLVDVRARARDRHRRRRRDRRRRGGDASHRARPGTEGSDAAGDEGGVGRRRRHRAHPLGGVHSRGVPRRSHRPDVPAVRADDRDLGSAVGLQRAVALAGACGDVAEAAPRKDHRPSRQVLFALQQGVRRDHGRVRQLDAPPGAAGHAHDRHRRGGRCRRRPLRQRASRGLRSR